MMIVKTEVCGDFEKKLVDILESFENYDDSVCYSNEVIHYILSKIMTKIYAHSINTPSEDMPDIHKIMLEFCKAIITADLYVKKDRFLDFVNFMEACFDDESSDKLVSNISTVKAVYDHYEALKLPFCNVSKTIRNSSGIFYNDNIRMLIGVPLKYDEDDDIKCW